MPEEDREFTLEELKAKNGEGGRPVLVAHDGNVYDVSASDRWKNGVHQGMHHAGGDLTDAFAAAPHGAEVFDRVRKVGVLVSGATEEKGGGSSMREKVGRLLEKVPYLRRAPHPALVHFPIAFAFVIPLFNLLYLIFPGHPAFESTAFYLVILGLMGAVVAIGTGLFSWWLNWDGRLIQPIKVKLIVGTLLVADLTALLAWRVSDRTIMLVPSGPRVAYFILSLMLPVFAFFLGFYGDRVTRPS